jgi:hypothetical protein
MNNNEPGGLYWDRLYTDFPDFQVALVDGDRLLARRMLYPLAAIERYLEWQRHAVQAMPIVVNCPVL